MIEILVVSYRNEAPAQPLIALFNHEGGSIGRSDDNHFVLPDPKHHVSRLQARVVSGGDHHHITNLSHANPTMLNGRELECDAPHPLSAGDEIQIGMYLLRARVPVQPHSMAAVGRSALTANAAGVAIQTGPASPLPASATAFNIAARTVHAVGESIAVPLTQPALSIDPAAGLTEHQMLLQAFLKGAGIPGITLTGGLTPEFMETVGALLATAIDGTVDLIGRRASVKREVNADVTMVVVRNNNPLKFLPDGATVLTQMLRKRMPGFMGPVDAMQDAFDDLQAHQLGLMAGMQASLLDLHRQLAPDTIDADHAAASRMERLFPVHRKAALWDRYCKLHQLLGNKVQVESHLLTGKVFLRAYEVASEQYQDKVSDER
ncbi:MAG: type VI secretion system-associated FHA domain protein TagH [Herminiimonas sp.]|nr:type VI secretion system-associated FHA domain protein TagH [Herminiimonas sp.]